MSSIQISKQLHKDIKISAIDKEVTIEEHINRIIEMNKEQVIEFINTNNLAVRNLLHKKDSNINIKIKSELIDFCKTNNFKQREVVIVAAYIYIKEQQLQPFTTSIMKNYDDFIKGGLDKNETIKKLKTLYDNEFLENLIERILLHRNTSKQGIYYEFKN